MKQLSVKVDGEPQYVIDEWGKVIYEAKKEWKDEMFCEYDDDWHQHKDYFVKLIDTVGQHIKTVMLCLEISTKSHPRRILKLYVDLDEKSLIQDIEESLRLSGKHIKKISIIEKKCYVEVSIMELLYEN